MSQIVRDFLAQVKINAEKKAKELATLELSVWNDNHERELKEHFSFTDRQLSERKKELQTIVTN